MILYGQHGLLPQEESMIDQNPLLYEQAITEITPELKKAINQGRKNLKGSDRRKFMARIVLSLGPKGQIRAERELNWNRNTIIKGIKELKTGIDCIDNLSARGRKKSEYHLPNLLNDIRDIVSPESQVDPTFRTDKLFCPLTAGEVRRRLIEEKAYTDEELPKERTIRIKLNDLGFPPQKVAKAKPKKK